MTKHLEQVREALGMADYDCHMCPNQGWYSITGQNGEREQQQCQWCYTTPNSRFNLSTAALSALSAHEEEVRELVMLSEHALTALRAHGYNIAADHLAEQIAKVKGEKK